MIGGLSLQRAIGVQIPIDPARAFVLGPLSIPAQTDPTLAQALLAYERASTRAAAGLGERVTRRRSTRGRSSGGST